MNLRQRARPETFGFQIAPMVDILLVLLVFFIVTWNFALTEYDLDVKVPNATQAKQGESYVDQTVVNIRADGTIMMNRKQVQPDELAEKLKQLAKLYPDYAVILRGDQKVNYKYIVDVLDMCRAANIYNIAFSTGRPE
jgi:biopolymer transport protein ExbD